MTKVICIMGPTATGKSRLALELSHYHPIEIINVDSALIYKGLDIGTAKPSKAELSSVPHHLISFLDPAKRYSAGEFCRDALKAISASVERKKQPVLVGGTMMYFLLLQKGFTDFPSSNPKVRESIDRKAKQLGWAALHDELKTIDPTAAASIHPNDPQRIQRALELYYTTGETRSELQAKQRWGKPPYDFVNVILKPGDRFKLHQRIEQRVDEMLQRGLMDEVKVLYQRGDLDETLPSVRAVGYRQVWHYLKGQYDLNTMRYKIIVATRQLAKRQMTWLNKFEGYHFDSEAPNVRQAILETLKGVLK